MEGDGVAIVQAHRAPAMEPVLLPWSVSISLIHLSCFTLVNFSYFSIIVIILFSSTIALAGDNFYIVSSSARIAHKVNVMTRDVDKVS